MPVMKLGHNLMAVSYYYHPRTHFTHPPVSSRKKYRPLGRLPTAIRSSNPERRCVCTNRPSDAKTWSQAGFSFVRSTNTSSVPGLGYTANPGSRCWASATALLGRRQQTSSFGRSAGFWWLLDAKISCLLKLFPSG